MRNKINLKEQKIGKICILMMGLLGDVLMRTPILREIKRIYPNAKITIVVDLIGSEALKCNPDVDKIYIVNRKKNNIFKYLYSKLCIQLKLISNKYDLVIDLYMSKASKNMTKLSLAKYQVGIFDGKVWSNKDLFKKDFQKDFQNKYHITNNMFEVLKYFEVSLQRLSTKPFVYSSLDTDKRVAEYNNKLAQNSYIISLGSGGLEKVLSMDKIFNLIVHIKQTYNLIPSVVLNPGQEFLQDELIEKFLIPNKIEHNKLKLLSIEEIV